MPLLRKAVLIPSKGVDWSQPSTFIDDRSGYPTNVRINKNELMKRPGKTLYGSVAISGGQIMGLGVLDIPTTKYLVRTSKTKFEKYDTGTNTWGSIALTDFTGGDDDLFFFSTVPESGYLIVTNGIDKIRKWTGSGNNSVLGGTPPLAKYLAYLSPYLVLGYTDDGTGAQPWNVQWCDTDNPEVWSSGNAGAALLSDEPSALQNIVKLNEYLACYKKNSIWLGRKVETSDIFQFDCVKTGIGLASPRAVADAEGLHYFMGFNDFHVWNGASLESFGKDVRDQVFSTIDRAKMNRCHAIHVQELNEIWFFIVASGYSWPKAVWKYNYKTGFWYYDTCTDITTAIRWEKVSSISWDAAIGTWDAQVVGWDASSSTEKWEEIVFGNLDGYTSYLDYNTSNDLGVAVSSFFESKDYTGDTLEFNKRFLKLDVWAKGTNGGKLYVDYSVNYGDSWTNIPYTSSQAYISLTNSIVKTEMYFDILSDKIRFRFRNSESGEVFYLRNFYPYYLAKDEVVTSR